MSIADKLVTIAENQEKVFDAGKQSEYDNFWDEFQQNGNRTKYNYCFASECWNDNTFKPKYDINLKGYSVYFGADIAVTDLAKNLEDCGVVLNTSAATDLSYMFYMADITKLPALNFSKATNLAYCIYACSALKEIEKITVTESQAFPNTFLSASNLEKVIFEGNISSNLNLGTRRKLTKESIESIVGCLSKTASGTTLTLSQTAVDNAFTTDEWNALIADKTNWTISLV